MHSSKRRGVALVVLLIVVSGAAGGILGLRDYYRPENVAVIGQPFPPLRLADLEGHAVSLDAYRGKKLLATFIQVGCGHCGSQLSILEKLGKRYADDGLALVAISTDTPTETTDFLDTLPVSYPIWIDAHRGLHKDLGTVNVPALFLLDEDGILRRTAVGYQSLQDVRRMVSGFFKKSNLQKFPDQL